LQEALESKVTVDDSQWLTYWLLSAVITLLERMISPIIPYFPLYPLLKCLFLGLSKLTATTAGLKDVPEQVKAAADDVFSNLPDAVGKQAHVQ